MMDFQCRPSVETVLRCISTFSELREQLLDYQKSSPFRLNLLQLQLAILLLRCLSERKRVNFELRRMKVLTFTTYVQGVNFET